MGQKKKFVMVAGNPRSGTTFVGKMLALPLSVTYFSEPFNAEYGMPAIDRYFPYVSQKSDTQSEAYKQVADDFVSGKAKFRKHKIREAKNVKQAVGRSIFGTKNNFEYQNFFKNPLIKTGIIKDPTASLLADYMHRQHGIPVVVTMRHPAAVVASFKRLHMGHSIENLLFQPALEADYYKKYLRGIDIHHLSPIEEAAWHWNCIYHVLLDFANKHKGFLIVRHEDISEQPLAEFKKLYEHLHLPFTGRIERIIAEHTAAHNPVAASEGEWHQLKRNSKENIHKWREILTKKETDTVRAITATIADKYYQPSSW